MDRMGSDWCEVNLETIVGWLRESARKVGLPFAAPAARALLRKAIKESRLKEQKKKDKTAP